MGSSFLIPLGLVIAAAIVCAVAMFFEGRKR